MAYNHFALFNFRKSHENKTAKRPSYKRTFSYSLSNESENTTKAEPAYIQILPDPVGSSDDGGDEKLELENLENASHERDTDKFKSEEDDYDVVVDELKPDQVKHYGDVNDALGITTSKCKDEEDGYDIVDEEVKQKVAQVNKENNTNRNDKRQKKTEDNYSHIKTDGRKISDTNINYSHVSLDDLYANKRISKPDNLLMETTIPMKENNTDDGYYSNLDVSIHNALQAMDKTIADFDNNETLSDRSECSDDDIEEETYNRLGSLKKKSEYGQNKFNYGQKQKRHRSRSLPADDLKPQFKAICDEVDTYDHLRKTEADGDNAHTYINWTPPRHVKSKSLPENQNLEYVKGIRKDADNYSHINLMETTPKRKIAVATMNPAHLVEDTKVSYNQILPEPNGYDFSVINRVNKQKGAKVNGNEKMAVFTLKEGESEDAQPHTYFILEPSTAL